MKDFVKWMDKAPWWLKIILCLPAVDIIWGVYRIVKGLAYGKVSRVVAGILWIIPGVVIGWLIDLICVIGWKKPMLLA